MAFPMVVKALQTEVAKPENRGYADNGGADFKQAAAWYSKAAAQGNAEAAACRDKCLAQMASAAARRRV